MTTLLPLGFSRICGKIPLKFVLNTILFSDIYYFLAMTTLDTDLSLPYNAYFSVHFARWTRHNGLKVPLFCKLTIFLRVTLWNIIRPYYSKERGDAGFKFRFPNAAAISVSFTDFFSLSGDMASSDVFVSLVRRFRYHIKTFKRPKHSLRYTLHSLHFIHCFIMWIFTLKNSISLKARYTQTTERNMIDKEIYELRLACY